MKLTVEEIDTLFDWYIHFEHNDLMTPKQIDAIDERNEHLRKKLWLEYKKLGGK
jgi:hypothetical protein